MTATDPGPATSPGPATAPGSGSRALSLRTRVIAGLLVVAVVLVLVSTLVAATTRGRLIAQVDQRLDSVSPGPGFPNGDRRPRAPAPDDQPAEGEPGRWERTSDLWEGYVDTDGALVVRFRPTTGDLAPPAVTAADLPEAGAGTSAGEGGRRTFTADSTDGATTYRVLAVARGDYVDITAVPIDDVQSTIRRLLVVQIGGALVGLAVLGLVGWWVIRLGLRPVKEMTNTAGRIADGDLNVRIPESAPGTESGDLAVALNRMLTTIGGALDERAESEARLRQFVADASHELRTPVTTIRGYAELYRHGGIAPGPTLDDAMRRTEQESIRMGRLVDDLVLLAKLDQHRPLERRPLDLAQLVRDATADARAQAPDRPITLHLDDNDVLPVEGDDDHLRQVLGNVLGNALVHTDPSVAVEVRASIDGGCALVEVRDHGQGMAPEVAARATDRFFRADPSRSRHRGGSGLGLAIATSIVAAHDGALEIESTPKAGTTVRLRLPIKTKPGP